MTESTAHPDEIDYSVVVPVYESDATVEELVGRIAVVFERDIEARYEIILVDDGSTNPETWPTLEDLSRRFDAVTAIQLTRNFGKASAVLCGFEHARGRWVITMDDDLQHLPEDLPKFVALRDHDVVMGSYRRRNHPWFKRATSRVKSWFDRVLAGKPRHLVSNPYRLHKARVVEAICRMQGPYPFISAMMYYATHDIVQVEITHGARRGRPSTFNFRRRLKSFANLIINRSAFIIRVAALAGLAVSAIALLVGVVMLLQDLFGETDLSVWNALLVGLVFTNGLALFAIAVLGEYATRILVGVERRPPFLVRRVTR